MYNVRLKLRKVANLGTLLLVEKLRLLNDLSSEGFEVTFQCYDTWRGISNVETHQSLGILYETHTNDSFLRTVPLKYFQPKFKWLLTSEKNPQNMNTDFFYESDITFGTLDGNNETGNGIQDIHTIASEEETVAFYDVYSHPEHPLTLHPWATWTQANGLSVHANTEKIRRRHNFQKMIFKTGTPIGAYDKTTYPGDFWEYLMDNRRPEQDSATRCGFSYMLDIFNYLNISCQLVPAKYWSSLTLNGSMGTMMKTGEVDVGGSILRMLPHRMPAMEFIGVLWPFRVGFTYVAARESDSNMFAAPFSTSVWWSTLACSILLALALLFTSRSRREKDEAVYATVATCLQQDASAVPEGTSGRWVFMVLSICSMIIHAYYTSAVVSSLLDGGKGGPATLTNLADSSFRVASEDVDYFRYLYFEETTDWKELEYLKKKKKTPQFYQPLEEGIKLIASGNTAYNTEFNGIYPLLAKRLSDSNLCRLRYIDLIPLKYTFVVAAKNSPFLNTLRVAANWLTETGIKKRALNHWSFKPPGCRATVLAEQVNIMDIMPLIYAMTGGITASLLVLGGEIIFHRLYSARLKKTKDDDFNGLEHVSEESFEDLTICD